MRRFSLAAGLALVVALVSCAGPTTAQRSSTGSASPSPSSQPTQPSSKSAEKTVPIDPQQAQRLQRVMVPLLRVMDHPRQPSQVKVGVLDDSHINAASAGGGEFYITRGLLEKANDAQLSGVLAHELAHDDLGHVAKAQRIGAEALLAVVYGPQILTWLESDTFHDIVSVCIVVALVVSGVSIVRIVRASRPKHRRAAA